MSAVGVALKNGTTLHIANFPQKLGIMIGFLTLFLIGEVFDVFEPHRIRL